ncbi:FliM/FliN family flagellar motor switch protein [Noviherbaspirillum galbum]|uniref:Flagellar motor switch protein FliN n=1 Tax=Noviherbaspirillum galbum TaxID=2709383 RepID=A0A6B3SQI3_9BURK|nr:FliM/FliN family flagellar motor switch protein [Noviherbaspirillum galbum]NEX63034.1 FliM/FliN family flagellar motor switch protein [Noviherbaspirillum galbum]
MMMDTDNQAQAHMAALPELNPAAAGRPVVNEHHLGALHGVRVKASVIAGEAQATLGEVLALRESSVLKLDRPADAPVDIMVDGQLVALGQLVVVDDHFGVRITQVLSGTRP